MTVGFLVDTSIFNLPFLLSMPPHRLLGKVYLLSKLEIVYMIAKQVMDNKT